MKVKVTQSCLTLCDPTRYTVHGILQARILERVAIPSPWDLPNPGIEPRSPTVQEDSLPGKPKQSACQNKKLKGQGSIPGLERAPGGGNSNPLQYSCLEKSHLQRSLAGYSPWGHKESNTTEYLSTVCLTDNGKEKKCFVLQ